MLKQCHIHSSHGKYASFKASISREKSLVSAISTTGGATNALSSSTTDAAEPGVGGVPSRYLGITPAFYGKLSSNKHHYPWYDSLYGDRIKHVLDKLSRVFFKIYIYIF